MSRIADPIPYVTLYGHQLELNRSVYNLIHYPSDTVNTLYAKLYRNSTGDWIKIDFYSEFINDCVRASIHNKSHTIRIAVTALLKQVDEKHLWLVKHRVYQDILDSKNTIYISLTNSAFDKTVVLDKWELVKPLHGAICKNKYVISGSASGSNNNNEGNTCYTFCLPDNMIEFSKYRHLFFIHNENTNEIYIKLYNDIFDQGVTIRHYEYKSTCRAFLSLKILKVLTNLFNKSIDFDDLPNLPKNVYLEIDKHPTMEDAVVIKDIYTQKACAFKSSTCDEKED